MWHVLVLLEDDPFLATETPVDIQTALELISRIDESVPFLLIPLDSLLNSPDRLVANAL